MAQPEEAVIRMARALQKEGLLRDLYVPLDTTRLLGWLSKFHVANAFPARRLRQWRHDPPAASTAVIPELTVALAYRGQSRRWLARLWIWRLRSFDRGVALKLRRARPHALIVLDRTTDHLAAANALHITTVLYNRAMGHEQSLASGAEQRAAMATEATSFLSFTRGPLDPAAHVLVQSERMRRDALARGFHPARITVISCGVDVERFRPVARDTASRPLRVVLVARVGYAKGVHYAALAARRASPGAVERLTVVGPDAADATLLRRELPDVIFTGDVPHGTVRRYLDEADVFLLPTLADSMARAIFEAMACGLPIITTPESGYEGIMRDGIEGFFVDGRDVEAIAERLQRLSADGDLRRRMGAAARALAEQYSWERFEDRFRAELSSSLSFLRSAGAG